MIQPLDQSPHVNILQQFIDTIIAIHKDFNGNTLKA